MPGVYPGVRSGPAYSDELRALDELGEPRAEVRTQVLALHGELDRRLQGVEGVPHVVPPALEAVGVHGLVLGEPVDRVGQLDLAAASGGRPPERADDLRH